MSSLKDVPLLRNVYLIFNSQSDLELCTNMVTVGLFYTFIVGTFSIFYPAPYGRYQKAIYGLTMNAKLAWLVQECMSFIIPLIIILSTECVQLRNFPNVVALALFMLHYFHRSFIYPTVTSSQSKPAPVLTVVSAMVFTSFNGLLQGIHLSSVTEIKDSIHGLIGTSIFLTGMAINISHDRMLASLRKDGSSSNSENQFSMKDNSSNNHKYRIPRGGLFEYVSGANYLGEIIEWTGYAVITREYPQIIFALFTAVFLGIRATHHHRFYQETFGSTYPKSRKAIIPYVL